MASAELGHCRVIAPWLSGGERAYSRYYCVMRMHALCCVEFKVNQVLNYTAEQDAQNTTNTKSEPQTSIPTGTCLPRYLAYIGVHSNNQAVVGENAALLALGA